MVRIHVMMWSGWFADTFIILKHLGTDYCNRSLSSDLIHLKHSDIDWRKGEIRLCQKKTGRTVYVPLVKQTESALQDYILNARPDSDCPEVFLRAVVPKTTIANAVCIGSMFQQYQKKAGIARHAFDEKGFHGLRRRLAKKLLITGTPSGRLFPMPQPTAWNISV